jgi:hypothetical protein
MATYTLDNVIDECKKNFITPGTSIIKNTDGTISVYTQYNDFTPTPFILSETCCKFLDTFNQTNPSVPLPSQGYYFDLQEQKCRWREKSKSACDEPIQNIKVILNPHGNDGSIFDINGNENCSLRVKFKYLIKFDCDDLANVVFNASKTSSSFQNQELIDLKNKLEEQKSISEQIASKLSSLAVEFSKTNYSIVCDTFPYNSNVKQLTPDITPNTSADTITLTNAQKSAFSKTAFGDLAPMSFALPTRVATFCIINDGLEYWKKILGDNDYIRFIEGDPNSYNCKHVIEMYNLNLELSKQGYNEIIVECNTPFGTKTALEKAINDNIILKQKSDAIIKELDAQISAIDIGVVDMGCTNILDYFENLTLTASIDVVNNDNTLTTVQPLQLFGLQTTLYNWLTQHPSDSGFYVCGASEALNGCTPLIYPEFTNGELPENVDDNVCDTVRNAIYDELFNQSGYDTTSDYDSFNGALSPTILASNWLSFDQLLSGDSFISQIANKKIKLSININNSCGVFCLLIDQITLQRECDDSLLSTIIFNESPGFNLTKVIDNKKSWLNNTEYDYRDFNITNVFDTNPIRQTEYDVNDERLVINTKEIDLNMNIASAVEYDVWCYMTENPCLLTASTCTSGSTLEPTDIYGNHIILPTATTVVKCESIVSMIKRYVPFCVAQNLTSIQTQFSLCYPVEECLDCGKVLKIKYSRIDDSVIKELWITCGPNNNLGFYNITDNKTTQATISNVTPSFTTECLKSLNLVIDNINQLIASSNPNAKLIENFWSNGTCESCCLKCGDSRIDFTELLSDDITKVKTIENFEYLMGDFIDVKSRKILSSYPTLRAIYDRYLNSDKYCGVPSLAFDYYKMDEFSNLITTYWDDLIEQVIPSTTLWGSIKVYTNTMFDQQKYKYKSYSSIFCNSPLNFVAPPSPINGSNGQCHDVDVIVSNIASLPEGAIARMSQPITYNSLCLTQMNWGSEFVGNVDILDGEGNYLNNDTFCNSCRKAVWYSMPESPDFVMAIVDCGLLPYTSTTFVIESFSISTVNSGNELVSIPLTSDTVNNDSIIWVPANNNVLSGCTLSNPTGWTYTNFVDFLNNTFITLGLTQYEARLSYTEITSQTFSDGSVVGPPLEKGRSGFYLIFPENDTFELKIYCTSQVSGQQTFVYSNDNLYINIPSSGPNANLIAYAGSTFGVNLAVDYDCKTNKINE